MQMKDYGNWQEAAVTAETVFEKIEPGMTIFLGTGAAEPRTLIKRLMASTAPNLQDLEIIQLVSLGEALTLENLQSHKYRLKTFYSGWVADEAITEGRVDLIPCRFVKIPHLIQSGKMHFDAAFIQVTPPNETGYCSLGVAVDIGRQVMDQAKLLVAEINPDIPFTYGDTFVALSEFDFFVRSEYEPIYLPRWPVDEVFSRVAANVASIIEDRSCIGFSIGPLFEALGPQLVHKRNLGIHSPFFTDALMDLVKSGAVSNRYKEVGRGKCLASYAWGTRELMRWLDRNPLVEFQGIDTVFSPVNIGRNPRMVTVLPARKVDLSGRIALHIGKGNVATTPSEAVDFVNGAELSQGGITVFALPSRNLQGQPNICLSVENFPNLLSIRESVDMIATEFGVANLKGCTVRERAQALIDIAHPNDRALLIEQAKANNIIYADQIFLAESAHLYPSSIDSRCPMKGGLVVHFRAIRPSDEEEMRRLFYRFSDEAVYYRYFSPIKVMPHKQMQSYVNVDQSRVLSIVGLVGAPGDERIIAEARFVKDKQRPYADVAFIVDEKYQGVGIASKLLAILTRHAREQGLLGFTADVLTSNNAMLRVFEKSGIPMKKVVKEGVAELALTFTPI
ncbi:MAG: GNAT family N-acetyltransferase [Deltaproteobacteria bacterium]|nr:GNAT family N-acetyltransferase [Deltaproteobacteria bacterium]